MAATVVLLDSVTEVTAAHAGCVVVTGSHGGRSVVRYALAVPARLYVFNDAGVAKDEAGIAALAELDDAAQAAVTGIRLRIEPEHEGELGCGSQSAVVQSVDTGRFACGIHIRPVYKEPVWHIAEKPVISAVAFEAAQHLFDRWPQFPHQFAIPRVHGVVMQRDDPEQCKGREDGIGPVRGIDAPGETLVGLRLGDLTQSAPDEFQVAERIAVHKRLDPRVSPPLSPLAPRAIRICVLHVELNGPAADLPDAVEEIVGAVAARSDHLIFIDGDCVPHPAFIESHLKVVKPGVTATGRRVELGPDFSTRLRKHQLELAEFVSPMNYLRSIPALKRDGTKNYEYGLHYPLLQWLSENRTIRLVGCNLSIHRDDLLKINGFNEEYQSPGIGEDSDIDWRLQMAGVTIRNVKFSAVQYHLYHPRSYTVNDRNLQMLQESQQAGSYICTHGISQHQAS